MTYRFAEFPARQLYTFLTNATTGIAARCTAINADINDGTNLPTSWTFPQFQPDRGLYLPMCLIEWSEDEAGEVVIDDAPYHTRYYVSLIMGASSTQLQRGAEALLRMRAQRVLRECFDTTKGGGGTWNGHTLSAANGASRVINARLRRVHSGPLVSFTDLNNTRAIVIVGEVETLHEESQSPTA